MRCAAAGDRDRRHAPHELTRRARPRPARCRARARARTRSPRRSTSSATVRTSPAATASAALTVRPDISQSSAVGMPTRRGRNHDEHASGTMPSRVNTKPNVASGAREARVHRERHRRADTDGRAVHRGDHRLRAVEDAQHDDAAGIAARIAGRPRRSARPTPRSAPAQNARPEPVTTTARTSGSASTRIERGAQLALHAVGERVEALRAGAT